jgi:hypothetical protein
MAQERTVQEAFIEAWNITSVNHNAASIADITNSKMEMEDVFF